MSPAEIDVAFGLNGRPVQMRVAPNLLLVDLLRDRLGLKGTKRSCDMEVCGACTVMVDDRLVSSCTTLAADVDGAELTTIEGLTPEGGLSRVQEAMVLHGAIQCGFCTPGFVVAIEALLRTDPHPSPEAIRRHLRGNVCRCTGYVKILAAVESLSRTPVAAAPIPRSETKEVQL